nr:unnamed protein product [Spirometra erinaceieuropaei]
MLVFSRPPPPPPLQRVAFPQKKDADTQTDAVADKIDPESKGETQSTVTRAWRMLRVCLAEILGTGLLAFVCVRTKSDATLTEELPALLVGPLALTMGTWLSGPVSGGHVNPAVTLTLILCQTLPPIYLPLYWSSQMAGACAGTYLAFAMNETTPSHHLGNQSVEFGKADKTQIMSELSASTVFLLNVVSGGDAKRSGPWTADGNQKSLSIGLMSMLLGTALGPEYPCSLNPAIVFGPATILNAYRKFLVPLLVPFVGSFIAAFLYKFVLCSDAECENARKLLQSAYLKIKNADRSA